jgi:predicted DNA-binding transcriptional regulator AlpA
LHAIADGRTAFAMTDRTLLDLRDLAKRIKRSLDWTYRALPGLIADHGFPAPLPGLGKRWDPVAVDAWLDAQLAPELSPARPQAAAAAPDWEAELIRRARAGQAPLGH